MRRAPAICGWVLLGLVGTLLLLALAIVVAGNTRDGRAWIEQATAHFSHQQVRLQGVAGRFPDRLYASELSLQDSQGTWLQADGVTVDWSPWALLTRRVHVEQLSAARLSWSRRPQYASGAAGTAPRRGVDELFQLPFTLQIDRLDLPRVQLAAPLAGSAVALRLQGGGSYRSLQRANAQLTVQRLDGVSSTYRAAARLEPRRIRVALDLAEQANGPLANLAHLSGLGALALQLQLDGPSDGLTVHLDGRANSLHALASGTLDLPDRSASLDLSLQAAAMALRPGLSWQSISLQGHAHGAFTAPSTSAQLDATGVVASTVRLGSVHAELHGEGQGLAMQATLGGLVLPAPLDEMLKASAVHLQGQARIEGLSGVALDVSLAHPLVNVQAHYELGSLRLGPRPRQSVRSVMRSLLPFTRPAGARANEGMLSATFPDLAPWAALAHLDLRGRGSLQGGFDLAPTRQALSFATTLAISGGDPQLTRLLAPRATLSAQLGFGDRSVRLLRSQLSAAHLQASAQGAENRGVLNVAWQLGLPDLAALALPATGQLSAQGRLQGAAASLALSGSADTHFVARGLPADLHVNLHTTGLPQRGAGELDVDGSLDHAVLALQASLQHARGGGFALSIQRGEWKSTRVQGTLRADGDWRTPQGELALRVGRLSDLDALLGTPLRGSAQGTVRLSGSGAGNRAQLELEARNLEVSAAQRVSLLQVSGTVGQPLHAPRLALQLSAAGTVGSIDAQLAASVNGAPSALQLQLQAHTTNGADNAAEVMLAATWRQPQHALQLTSLQARYRQQSARLLAPAVLSFHDGIFVDHLSLSVPPAELQMHGRLTPTPDLQASVSNLASALVSAVMPQFRSFKPQGRGEAQIALHGSWAEPAGSVTFSANGLGSGSAAVGGLPAASLRVQAQFAGGNVDLNAAADAGTHMRVRVTGRVPLRATLPMHLQLDGTMDLNIANAVLAAGGQRVLGQLRVQAQVDGTPQVPHARGELSVMDASYQDYARGLSLSGIQATLRADDTQLRLTQLSAKAGTGTLTASGSIDLAAHGLPVQLRVDAHNAQPVKSDLLTTSFDMGIGVSGTLAPQRLAATGTVRIIRATINIPNGMPANVPVLNVVKPGQQAQLPATAEPLIAQLNLTVNAPTGIFVRGRGLSVQVGGTVHATGSSSKPTVSGGFDLINGTLDMAGASLTFSSGRVSFNGTGVRHRIDPTLDFTATSSSGGITTNLQLSGYADAPVITLTSTPPLPQDEILARLLFGESVAQLSPLQIAGIGAALVSLSGSGGGGFNPLTTVEHALGLNRLVISSSSSSASSTTTGGAASAQNTGTTIEAGRYITNRIYVGAKQSTNGMTQAQVQIDLSRNLKVQTTLSSGGGTVQGATPENDPGSSVGITYQFQF